MTTILRDSANGVILRCSRCGKEHATNALSLNVAYWQAEELGWELTDENRATGETTWLCETCTNGGPTSQFPWRVRCDWCEDEFDESFATEGEAKEAKKQHERGHWQMSDQYGFEPEPPDVFVEGPEDRRRREEMLKDARQREAERRRQEKIAAQEERTVRYKAALYDKHAETMIFIGIAKRDWWRRMLLRMAGVL